MSVLRTLTVNQRKIFFQHHACIIQNLRNNIKPKTIDFSSIHCSEAVQLLTGRINCVSQMSCDKLQKAATKEWWVITPLTNQLSSSTTVSDLIDCELQQVIYKQRHFFFTSAVGTFWNSGHFLIELHGAYLSYCVFVYDQGLHWCVQPVDREGWNY